MTAMPIEERIQSTTTSILEQDTMRQQMDASCQEITIWEREMQVNTISISMH